MSPFIAILISEVDVSTVVNQIYVDSNRDLKLRRLALTLLRYSIPSILLLSWLFHLHRSLIRFVTCDSDTIFAQVGLSDIHEGCYITTGPDAITYSTSMNHVVDYYGALFLCFGCRNPVRVYLTTRFHFTGILTVG